MDIYSGIVTGAVEISSSKGLLCSDCPYFGNSSGPGACRAKTGDPRETVDRVANGKIPTCDPGVEVVKKKVEAEVERSRLALVTLEARVIGGMRTLDG